MNERERDELLREIAAGVRRLVELAERPASLHASDRRALQALLPAIVDLVGDSVFTVKALHPQLDRILAAAGGPRRLGRLFRRADGIPVRGWRIVAVGQERAGVIWHVTPANAVNRGEETRNDPHRCVTPASPQSAIG